MPKTLRSHRPTALRFESGWFRMNVSMKAGIREALANASRLPALSHMRRCRRALPNVHPAKVRVWSAKRRLMRRSGFDRQIAKASATCGRPMSARLGECTYKCSLVTAAALSSLIPNHLAASPPLAGLLE